MSYIDHLNNLKKLSSSKKKKLISTLRNTCPVEKWPRTMPVSVDPKLVLIGVSPGVSRVTIIPHFYQWDNAVSLIPEETFYIVAIEPDRQFEKQWQYKISLRVIKRETMEWNTVWILGFSFN